VGRTTRSSINARLSGTSNSKSCTNWRTEILAGITTFVTMAYIIFVNPSILHETGMPLAAVVAATCLCAAFGSVLMGAFARYPIALAPGMGLNAYFTYTVVKGMGAMAGGAPAADHCSARLARQSRDPDRCSCYHGPDSFAASMILIHLARWER
jgi:Permease family